MKKTLIKIFGLLILSTTMFACTGDKGGDSSTKDEQLTPPAPQALSLDVSSTSLLLCDSLQLNANYGKIEGEELEFASSNPSVVSVDEMGKMTAENVGTATITATYGEQTATCLVTVTTNNYSPYLVFENEISDAMTISATADINLGAWIGFNSNTYLGEITYKVDDTTIGEMVDDYFIPAQSGETTLTVVGAWKGFESASLIKTITVKVIDDIEIALNGGGVSQLNMYTVEEHGGIRYETSADFDVVVKVNGEKQATNVSVLEGEDVISYDSSAKKINALTYGFAKMGISFIDSKDNPISHEVNVYVERPVADYQNTVEGFSATDGVLPLETIFGESVTITEAWQGESQLTVEENKVLGLKVSSTAITETTVTVYTATKAYNIPVKACSKWITTGEEFVELRNSGATSGFYVLENDINMDGSTCTTAKSFNAMFDGQGHTITVTKMGYYGLFGKAQGARVKNLGVKITSWNYNSTTATGTVHREILAHDATSATFENIYVEESSGATVQGFSLINGPATTMKNVIVNFVNDTDFPPALNKGNFGILSGYNSAIATDGSLYYENVNVISTFKYMQKSNGTNVSYVWFAQNDSAAKAEIDGLMTDSDTSNDPLKAGTHFDDGDVYGSFQYGYKNGAASTTERIVNRYDSASAMYADENARQIGNWTVGEDGTISWTETVETPTETPEN